MSSATSNLFTKADSSDYITAKRRMTIAKEYVQASTENQFNPVKNNKATYNQNYRFIPTTTSAIDASNCLIQSKSFDLLQNYNMGKEYIDQICK